MDGIAAAKAKGIKFGRPRVEPPDNFAEIVNTLENKVITAKEAMQQSGMAEDSFYRRLREYRKKAVKLFETFLFGSRVLGIDGGSVLKEKT